MARDRKCNILENARQLVFQKGEGSEDAKLMLLRLDSLINSDVVPENIYVQAVIGTLFRKQGKIIYAVELYLEAVSCYEQKKELTDDEKQALIQFYIPLGASHEELGMWNRAMDFYMKALSISEDYNYETYKAMIYNNIGAIYYNREEFEKAEEYVLKALEINKKTGIKRNYSIIIIIWAESMYRERNRIKLWIMRSKRYNCLIMKMMRIFIILCKLILPVCICQRRTIYWRSVI